MNHPITALEKSIASMIEDSDIVLGRWTAGIDHSPKSIYLARLIAAIDWLYFDDSFGFRFGGDGDNGETFTYILDILNDLIDKGLIKI